MGWYCTQYSSEATALRCVCICICACVHNAKNNDFFLIFLCILITFFQVINMQYGSMISVLTFVMLKINLFFCGLSFGVSAFCSILAMIFSNDQFRFRKLYRNFVS